MPVSGAADDCPEHLLVVDNDREIRCLLDQYLSQAGYRVSAAEDGKAMRRVMDQSQVDLLVLDLMLPGDDGLALCRDVRSRSNLPILMLTARDAEIDRIVGLEMGADDCLPKPFRLRELLVQIRSNLRRAQSLPPNLALAEVSAFRFAAWSTRGAHRIYRVDEGPFFGLNISQVAPLC